MKIFLVNNLKSIFYIYTESTHLEWKFAYDLIFYESKITFFQQVDKGIIINILSLEPGS